MNDAASEVAAMLDQRFAALEAIVDTLVANQATLYAMGETLHRRVSALEAAHAEAIQQRQRIVLS